MSKSGKDSLLGNKIAASVLTAGLVFWGANRIAQVFIPQDTPDHPAIAIAALPSATTPQTATAAPGPASILARLASADTAKGKAFAQQQCAACHTFTQGGANGVGPNLYGVLGSPMFAHAGFSFSDAAKAKAKGDWTYDTMNDWLAAPNKFAPGTAMSYPGIHNTQTRADVVAYLRTLSASPMALPTPAEIKAAQTSTQASAPTNANGGTQPQAAAVPAAPSLDQLLTKADPAKGQAVAQQECSACHTFTKGGANGIGPNLYGIVGDKAFSRPGFSYSGAVKAKAGQPWTPARLSAWLKAPNSYAPGTAMSFAGIKNDQTRADVIAYLNQNAATPAKLP